MLNPKRLDELAKQISKNVPPGVKLAAGEFEKQTKQLLQTQLSKLDLVSREEFDAQCGVLAKTREKLEALEKQVAALESQHNPQSK